MLLTVLYYCIGDFPHQSQFQSMFMLSVAILSILCHCFKAVSLVGI